MKPYRPLDEILEIFQIKLATAKAVLKKHRVDTFSNKGKLMIHAKDFYKAYTKSFNPSLFEFAEQKPSVDNGTSAVAEQAKPTTNSDIFQKLFGSSYQAKKPSKSREESLWQANTF
ncbi:MAG: hypothetical protein NTX91_02850 [candidate division SR1 bacterium]|nr:hypothetical protein [candidate division SR1 bacterium]